MASIITVDSRGNESVQLKDGSRRSLGWKPPSPGYKSTVRKFGSRAGRSLIPRSKWVPFSLKPYIAGIKDQDGFGACGGHALASGGEVLVNKSGAHPSMVSLSAWFAYSLINGGRDGGVSVQDGLKSLQTYGTCLDASVKYGTYQKSKIGKAAFEEALRFRLFDGYLCSTFDEIGSAIQYGDPVVIGIFIGNRFEPNSAGVIPEWDGSNVGGHAMLVVGSLLINGKWHLETVNSWRETWGLNGTCYIPESYFKGQGWPADCIALQSPTWDPLASLPPKLQRAYGISA